MSVTAGVNGGQRPGCPLFAAPAFYISDLGLAADGAGEAYQVAAYGFGGASTINCSR